MKKIIILLGVLAAHSLLGFGPVLAQESTAAVTPLTGQDYGEIKALYARYNQGSDFRDAELFLSAFAEDAVMSRDGVDIEGMTELRADRARRYEGQTGDVSRRHFNGSLLIKATVEGASARTYYVLYDVAARPRTIISSGYYLDEFVRTDDGWRIKYRALIIDATAE